MDNPSTESSSLNMDSAAQAFGALLDPQPVEEKSPKELENELLTDLTAEKQEDQPVEEEATAEDDEGVTIEVDGKQVKLSKAELADAYKNGLRQSDYTKKTMEAADVRKAAEAEIQKAAQERSFYAQNLMKVQAQLEGSLTEYQNADWATLLREDLVLYLEHQRIFQERQAAYQQNAMQLNQIQQIHQSEQAKLMQNYVQMQREELLAKLPEWKDPSKQATEMQAIAKYLIDSGFSESDILGARDANGNVVSQGLTDHRAVIIGRKAMLYDAMMAKANAAGKKVATIPQKVLKPSVGATPNLDGRSAAMKQLSKSGKVEDAAALFGHFI